MTVRATPEHEHSIPPELAGTTDPSLLPETDDTSASSIETTSSGVAYEPVDETVINVPVFRGAETDASPHREADHSNGYAGVPPAVGTTALNGAHHTEAETGGPQTSDPPKPNVNGAKQTESKYDNVDASKVVAGVLANVLGKDPLAMSAPELSHALREVINRDGLPGNVTISQAYGLVAAARKDPRWRPFDANGRQSNGIPAKNNGARHRSS